MSGSTFTFTVPVPENVVLPWTSGATAWRVTCCEAPGASGETSVVEPAGIPLTSKVTDSLPALLTPPLFLIVTV